MTFAIGLPGTEQPEAIEALSYVRGGSEFLTYRRSGEVWRHEAGTFIATDEIPGGICTGWFTPAEPAAFNADGRRAIAVPESFRRQAICLDLANMKAAVQEVGVPAAEARLLLAHLEFGARALVNTGGQPKRVPCPVENAGFEPRLAEDWNHMTEVEDLFDAISNGDLALLGSLLPKRLLPHAELMSHALAESLDPLGRVDRRYGRLSKRVKPLEWVEFLLAHCDLDVNPADGDEQGRFRHLQAMIEAYTGESRLLGADAPLHAVLRAATRDRFLSTIERDRACVRLLGSRGQTLLHDAAMAGEAELAAR
jgi:hypothetical protein